MSTALVPGSLAAIARHDEVSLAETFLGCEVMVICDTSGSMAALDGRGGRTRYDAALEELAALQTALPGKIGVIAFSSEVAFCPDGKPFNFGRGTDLARALLFARAADVPEMRFIVISDGQPEDAPRALAAAADYKNRIDTIFVGPEEDAAGGQRFLAQLAKASGGQAVTADRVLELATKVQQLLAN